MATWPERNMSRERGGGTELGLFGGKGGKTTCLSSLEGGRGGNVPAETSLKENTKEKRLKSSLQISQKEEAKDWFAKTWPRSG